MQYDPSEELEMEQQLSQLRESHENTLRLFGPDHPFTKAMDVMIEAMHNIDDIRRERVECFDEERRDELKKEAFEMMIPLQKLLQKVLKICNNRLKELGNHEE